MMRYKVNELFQTLQGEGSFTGLPAIFVRLQGCEVGCPWCDTRHTWSVNPADEVPFEHILDRSNDSSSWAYASATELLSAIRKLDYRARLLVITGGEPCMYDLRELSSLFIEQGYQVQVETSGTEEVLVHPQAWVTVSPKVNMKGKKVMLHSALLRANEIKHPVATDKDIDNLDELLQQIKRLDDKVICLQPISQKKRATQLCVDTCIERGWRLSAQTHKYLAID